MEDSKGTAVRSSAVNILKVRPLEVQPLFCMESLTIVISSLSLSSGRERYSHVEAGEEVWQGADCTAKRALHPQQVVYSTNIEHTYIRTDN